MKATFKALFKDLLATTFKDASVTIVNGSNSAIGYAEYDSASEFGETLNESFSGTAHALTDEIGTLSYASVVKIGTRTAFVTSFQIDALGVETTFQFTSTRPMQGGDE